jgi:TolB-like protein
MDRDRYEFGPFVLDLRRRALLRNGNVLPIGNRGIVLLEALLSADGKPVSKSDLMDAAWPGAHVEENNLSVQIAALRKVLGTTPEGDDWIATVQRHGYQLLRPGNTKPEATSSSEPHLAIGQSRPSIAVLPFSNLSSDSEQDYFSDGVAEEIIIALSQMRWLFVIARNSSFTYKGRSVDVKQVGKDLGVRYVVEGSVRRAQNRLRITAQLIDAELGTNLWAGKFDGIYDDIFDLQDRVTASIVGAIAPKLEAAEIDRVRRKPTDSSDAYDQFLRGMMGFHSWTREGSSTALRHFYKAAELDPNYGAALGMAARTYVQRNAGGWMADREHEFAETERVALRAAEIGRDDAVCLSTAGFALSDVLNRVEDGDALIEKALALNSNLAWAWLYSSWVKTALGQPELALERVARAMELSPHDPQTFSFHAAQAMALLFTGRFAEARRAAAAALRDRPDFLMYSCVCIASAFHEGQLAEARQIADRMRAIHPGLSLRDVVTLVPIRSPVHYALWEEGLRGAGIAHSALAE